MGAIFVLRHSYFVSRLAGNFALGDAIRITLHEISVNSGGWIRTNDPGLMKPSIAAQVLVPYIVTSVFWSLKPIVGSL